MLGIIVWMHHTCGRQVVQAQLCQASAEGDIWPPDRQISVAASKVQCLQCRSVLEVWWFHSMEVQPF